jgi:hypothetical protein
MNQRSHRKSTWILDQLIGIRNLEARLTRELAAGGENQVAQIRRGMTELQLRLALLDRALEGAT